MFLRPLNQLWDKLFSHRASKTNGSLRGVPNEWASAIISHPHPWASRIISQLKGAHPLNDQIAVTLGQGDLRGDIGNRESTAIGSNGAWIGGIIDQVQLTIFDGVKLQHQPLLLTRR